MPLLLCALVSAMLSSCQPPRWRVVERETFTLSVDEARSPSALHVTAALRLDGCAGGCGGHLRISPRLVRGTTAGSRLFVVSDDPAMAPWEHWGCEPDCVRRGDWFTYFEGDCEEAPCEIGYTFELESSTPVEVAIDLELTAFGPADDALEEPPAGVRATIEAD